LYFHYPDFDNYYLPGSTIGGNWNKGHRRSFCLLTILCEPIITSKQKVYLFSQLLQIFLPVLLCLLLTVLLDLVQTLLFFIFLLSLMIWLFGVMGQRMTETSDSDFLIHLIEFFVSFLPLAAFCGAYVSSHSCYLCYSLISTKT
jgi:hypothetical protein